MRRKNLLELNGSPKIFAALKREGFFDAIFNIRSSAFAFSSEYDDQIILKNLFISLKPGGKVILEIVNPAFMFRYFQDQSWMKLENNQIVLIRRSWKEYQEDSKRRVDAYQRGSGRDG